jgi:hypothetical protein
MYPAPSVGAEGRPDFIVGFQPFHIGQEITDRGEQVVVQGRRTDDHRPGVQHFGHDITAMDMPQVHGNGVDTGRCQTARDRLGHRGRAVPHGIVNDQRLVLRRLLGPAHIGIDNFGDILAPDDAMVRADHVELKPHLRYFFKQLEGFGGIQQ